MADEKKFLFDFKIYSSRDLSKKWFVYWYSPTGRIRKYGNINKYDTFSSRMDAAIEFINELKNVHTPEYIHPTKVKVDKYMESRKELYRKKGYETYQSIVNTFFSWLGEKPVTTDNIYDFFVWLHNNRSKTTYNKYREKLKQILRAIGEGYKFPKIEKARAISIPARYFQSYQVKRLKKAIMEADMELWDFIGFMFYGLMRPNEIRQLRTTDIMLDERKILVRGQISKNGKSEYIAIPDPWVEDIERILYESNGAGGYVFENRRGNHYSVNRFATKHRKYLRELNFTSDYKFYSWKHTGAVHAIKAGISIKELQLQLRHHSLDQVNDYLRQMGVADLDGLKAKYPSI